MKKGEKSVTCNICNISLVYHGGTSSMLQHLKRKHPIENCVKPPDKQKLTKLDIFSRKPVCSTEWAGAMNNGIAIMIIKDLRPSIRTRISRAHSISWARVSPTIEYTFYSLNWMKVCCCQTKNSQLFAKAGRFHRDYSWPLDKHGHWKLPYCNFPLSQWTMEDEECYFRNSAIIRKPHSNFVAWIKELVV